MRYSTDAALKEVRARGARIRVRRERRVTAALSGASALLTVALFSCFLMLQPLSGSAADPVAFGAFLLPGEAGGYVLVGVVAFVIGVSVVIFISRRRNISPRFRDGGDGK